METVRARPRPSVDSLQHPGCSYAANIAVQTTSEKYHGGRQISALLMIDRNIVVVVGRRRHRWHCATIKLAAFKV